MSEALTNRRMLAVRDRIDADYGSALDIETLAADSHLSPDHLIRTFARVFGETPHRYLQRRRVERAMFLLRGTDAPVTEICAQVGFTSLGSFTRTFSTIVGESPTAHRRRGPLPRSLGCFTMSWMRPSTATHPANSSISEKRGDASRA
ncbi:helix-turn-helix domain-containing protein [Aeromicrobium piscarium]|uniref:Helix-turn-helix transcriptional regulator n=1 Tax=Aeromicrobium piscarium TaxID=2590901 RepID=A0A554RUQ3_9ACTN|nr:AraC family transcriptional regulator [Aeromicrobium piscarium]TSD57842.1 helix-turn-helix transcriptional regulator [Aeromicrobium piscarium]